MELTKNTAKIKIFFSLAGQNGLGSRGRQIKLEASLVFKQFQDSHTTQRNPVPKNNKKHKTIQQSFTRETLQMSEDRDGRE